MPGPVLGAAGTQVIVCVRILCLVSELCLGGVCLWRPGCGGVPV